MPFAPPIPDRAGRGALCALIDQLAKDLLRLHARGEKRDLLDAKMVERRLDQAREKFSALYQSR